MRSGRAKTNCKERATAVNAEVRMKGARLAALRSQKGWEQSDLALLIDYSTQAVWYFENGQRKIPNDVLPRLAEVFNVPIEELTRE